MRRDEMMEKFPKVQILSLKDFVWALEWRDDGTFKEMTYCGKDIMERHLEEFLRERGCEEAMRLIRRPYAL